ncbi:MAG: hypothetical protein ACI8TL_000040 [Natronomonas sp.]|jgi:hypothetical protein
MSTTITTPAGDEACAYRGRASFEHDPIRVRDCTDTCGSPAYLCDCGCLSAYIEKEGPATDAICEWSPE